MAVAAMAWAVEMAQDAHKRELAEQTVAPIDAEDFAIWGYDKGALFDKVAEAAGQPPRRDKKYKWNSYRLKRKMYMSLKKDIHQKPLGRALKKIKYYCDVLLRE